jgi:protein-tyrosine-phosphatase
MEAAHGRFVKRLLGWGASKPRMISEFDPQTPLQDIQDPYGEPLDAYQDCIRTLRPCIKGVLLWLASTIQ